MVTERDQGRQSLRRHTARIDREARGPPSDAEGFDGRDAMSDHKNSCLDWEALATLGGRPPRAA
jgi:hypothetical protein